VWLRLEKLDWDASRGIIENQMALDAGLANKLRRVESRWQELYDETNGSPLALMHTLGLMRMRAALTFDDVLAMLQGNRDPDLQKFIFQEARKELTANDKTALEALSFFVPSATFEAWRQVTSLSHNALETTIDRLSALSLVDVLSGEERYALHPLTRAFVRDELLADANIALDTGMRFARYWADYAENYGCDRYESYKKLDVEWANLEKLLQWLCDTASVKDDNVGNNDAAQMLVDIASSLSFFLSYSGRWDEYISLHKKAYDAARALNNWRKMGWRAFDIAWIKYKQGDIEKADDCLKKCKNAWKHEGTQGDQASATRLEDLIALQKKEYDVAEALLLKALKIRLNLNDKREVAFVLNSLGQLAHKRKQYELAAKKYKEALSLAENINDKVGQSIYLGNLGELALSRKNWQEARKLFERTLPLAKEVGKH
jgi:tetratricopeptide (TPR) repeat protein